MYGKNNRKEELVVFVQLGKDVDVVGGLLGSWIEQDVSRCVRAIGVEKDWKIDSLKKRAEEKGRKLEGISDTINPAGVSSLSPIPFPIVFWLNQIEAVPCHCMALLQGKLLQENGSSKRSS